MFFTLSGGLFPVTKCHSNSRASLRPGDRLQIGMTRTEPQVFRRTRRRTRRTPAQKLWIWLVFLFACACVAILFLFSWDDSPASEPSHPHASQFGAGAPPAYGFHAPSGKSSPDRSPVPKIDALDEKQLKGFESKPGPENSGTFPLQNRHEPSDAMPLVPTQSVRPDR